MTKLNFVSLTANLEILDGVIFGNSFLGLNVYSNCLWSDLSKNFRPNRKFLAISLLHTSFSIFD